MLNRAAIAGAAACLLGAAWYLPRRIKRGKAQLERERSKLEGKSRSSKASWACDAPVDAEWFQLVLERFEMQGEAIDSARKWLDESVLRGVRPHMESQAAGVCAEVHQLMASCEDTYHYLNQFLRVQPRSLMWLYPALEASPWDQTSAKERLEVIMGIRDSLIISGEMMQGCMAIVNGLAADSPDRAATIVELVPQAYNLYILNFHLASCLNTFVRDSSRVPLVRMTRPYINLYDRMVDIRPVPVTQETLTEIRATSTQHLQLSEAFSGFLGTVEPLLLQHNAAPWYVAPLPVDAADVTAPVPQLAQQVQHSEPRRALIARTSRLHRVPHRH
ncbi:hypothetical protein JKP88DRAFT_249346 [Tribonema minus]|uniref:Uncharacterized protein n=1 Tax=Tribonema minus TaxID=303371 RepID=A0A835YMV9_9STRA|nr:hypothetical protein JKP88DRAFT_249346 [Tribonema minus]